MFMRSKLVKGHRYYHVIEGYREGGKVRQRLIVSLAHHPTIEAALPDLNRRLAQLRRRRTMCAQPNPSKRLTAILTRFDSQINGLTARVDLLTKLTDNIRLAQRPLIWTE